MNHCLWLIRREFWENRAIWITPLVVLGALLHARLVNARKTPGMVDEVPPFLNGDGYGLLAIDVLARLHGHGGHRRGPVVRHGDQHRVDVGAGQYFANRSASSAVAGRTVTAAASRMARWYPAPPRPAAADGPR